MNENEKTQPQLEELTPAQELSVALIRMADAILLLAKCVCQGDDSLGTIGNHIEASEPEPKPTLNSAPAPEEKPIAKADLRAFLMTKDKDAVRELFADIGVTKFSEIPEERYPDVLARAQALPDKEAA